jgi:hypothetical protein
MELNIFLIAGAYSLISLYPAFLSLLLRKYEFPLVKMNPLPANIFSNRIKLNPVPAPNKHEI